MPKSPLALQLDAIQRPMTMLLKSQEFRMNGRTFKTDGTIRTAFASVGGVGEKNLLHAAARRGSKRFAGSVKKYIRLLLSKNKPQNDYVKSAVGLIIL